MDDKPPILDYQSPPRKHYFYWRSYPPPAWTTILTSAAFALTMVDLVNDNPFIGALVVVFLVALAIDRWIRWTRDWRADGSPPLPWDSRIGFGILAVLMTTAAAFLLAIPLATIYPAIRTWRAHPAFGLPELAAALAESLGELPVFSVLALPFGFIAYLIWQPVGLHFLPRRRKHDGR